MLNLSKECLHMYITTRGGNERLVSAAAIKKGIGSDGGLFVPESLPHMDTETLAALLPLDYKQRAVVVLRLFLHDYDDKEIEQCVNLAYGKEKFDCPEVAPLVPINDNTSVLELWHGPTSAFKDMALQLLPQLLSQALYKTEEKDEIVILVATSGDTGKAALEGFKNVNQTQIIVFYPKQGVSEIQRLQMVSQEGNNVKVIAVEGNFDDAQTGVKQIFNAVDFNKELALKGIQLSSANSINWGRLVPQIVYYFSAYADMVNDGKLVVGQNANFVVPTGNFGNILAGYYAMQLGLPVNKLICASNSNNVLTEFLQTGVYNRNRGFNKTISPSMDILISSNLERLLFHVSGNNAPKVKGWMDELSSKGKYQVDKQYLDTMQKVFWADWASDSEAMDIIGKVFKQHNYVLDPHTAVAWQVCEKYTQQTGDNTPNIIVSTASPFKFNESVLEAIKGENNIAKQSEFAMLDKLSEITGWPVPKGLAELENKAVLHNKVCDKKDMQDVVQKLLGE